MSKISKELIESYRKIVLPFVSNRLYKTNFEGQGETDKAEFEQDFNEILDLAISALNPTGDCISREVLKDEVRKHAEYYADRTREDRYNVGYTECACEVLDFIDNAQAVEPFTQKEKEEIANAIKYLLGAELLEENGYTEEVKNALRSALKKVGGQEV